jgi:hypothetical protein
MSTEVTGQPASGALEKFHSGLKKNERQALIFLRAAVTLTLVLGTLATIAFAVFVSSRQENHFYFAGLLMYPLIGAAVWWMISQRRLRLYRREKELTEFEMEAAKLEDDSGQNPSSRSDRARAMFFRRKIFGLRSDLYRARRGIDIGLALVAVFLLAIVFSQVLNKPQTQSNSTETSSASSNVVPTSPPALSSRPKLDSEEKFPVWVSLFLMAIIATAWFRTRTNRIQGLELDIRDAELELDLTKFKVEAMEGRAEKLFRANQWELGKYYALNLQNSRLVLLFGLFCVASGIAIAGLVMWLLYDEGSDGKKLEDISKYVIGALGAVTTLLVNYVAAVIVKMHGTSSDEIDKFHQRLVETNELFLANVIASRIEKQEARIVTFQKMSESIAAK